MRSMFRFGVAVAAVLFVVDQASKLYVHDLLVSEGLVARAVLPFLNLVTVWNHGISFGLFNVAEGVVRWLFVALGMTAIHYRNEFLHLMRDLTHLELFPASVYGFTELPALLVPRDIALICGSALFICVLAGLAPAWNAARLRPVEALRYE